MSHRLADFLTFSPDFHHFRHLKCSFLPSFLPCVSASVYPCRSNKFFPVVKMNHPVVDFTASSVPLTWCLVLVSVPSESFLPSPRPQLWSPHLFPEVCIQRLWYSGCDLCLSLPSSSVILMRFYPHMFGTLFSISFVLYQFFFFFFFWAKPSSACAHACWYKSSLCREQTHRSLGQELACQPQSATFLLRCMFSLLCLFERYRDRQTGYLPSHLVS